MHYRKPKVSIQESSAAGYESDNSRIDQVRVPSSMESMTNRSLSVAQQPPSHRTTQQPSSRQSDEDDLDENVEEIGGLVMDSSARDNGGNVKENLQGQSNSGSDDSFEFESDYMEILERQPLNYRGEGKEDQLSYQCLRQQSSFKLIHTLSSKQDLSSRHDTSLNMASVTAQFQQDERQYQASPQRCQSPLFITTLRQRRSLLNMSPPPSSRRDIDVVGLMSTSSVAKNQKE